MALKQLTICTLKKSASIFGEIGAGILLFGSTILASAISGLLLAYFVREVVNLSSVVGSVLANPISAIIGFTINVVEATASFFTISFFGIPLWAILLVPVAIAVYSFLWCVNRELTEEDKKHDVIGFGCAIILSGFFAVIVEVIFLIKTNGDIIGVAYAVITLGSSMIITTFLSKFISPVYHHYFKVKK